MINLTEMNPFLPQGRSKTLNLLDPAFSQMDFLKAVNLKANSRPGDLRVSSSSSGSTTYSSRGAQASSSTQNMLDKNDFLRLLVTQLTNQDPLNPMDSTEFVAQLASLAQVEQLYNANDALATIIAYQSSINASQCLNLLGREVQAIGNLVTLEKGEASPIGYILPEEAKVTVKIYNAEGRLVRTVSLGQQEAGEHSFSWDGKDDAGQILEDGAYTFDVVATNANDYPLEVTLLCQGTVTGIRFAEDGSPRILVGPYDPNDLGEDGQPVDHRIEVSLSQITQIMGYDLSAFLTLANQTKSQPVSGQSLIERLLLEPILGSAAAK